MEAGLGLRKVARPRSKAFISKILSKSQRVSVFEIDCNLGTAKIVEYDKKRGIVFLLNIEKPF
jgi:hypothetical protein